MKFPKCPNCSNYEEGFNIYQCKKCDGFWCFKGGTFHNNGCGSNSNNCPVCRKSKDFGIIQSSFKCIGYIKADVNRKQEGCFITTSCTKSQGLGDDCYELKTLRKFRDNYIKKLPGGNAEIQLYYEISPLLIAKINNKQNSKEIWKSTYSKILISINLIEQNRNFEAYSNYKKVVKDLIAL